MLVKQSLKEAFTNELELIAIRIITSLTYIYTLIYSQLSGSFRKSSYGCTLEAGWKEAIKSAPIAKATSRWTKLYLLNRNVYLAMI